MSDKHPEYIYGFNAGVQAAWEAANAMAQMLSPTPVTEAGKVMRDAALDIADNILALKKRVPAGENPGT